MSHEVVNGVVKVVVRTVPGIQLPRVLKPVLRGKDVEFTDTRAYPLAAKGKFPFQQSFHTVNNITDRAQVKGVITIDRARRAAGGSDATTLRVEGECVVRMGVGISGKVEKIIVDSIRRGYLKLPGIIEEWAAVRHLHLGVREGARSLSRGPVPTAPRAISRTSSADSFKSATSAELSEFGSASSQSALAGGPQGGSGAGGSAGFVPALPPPPATPPEPPRGPSFARGANEGGEAIPLRGSMGAGAGSFADAATPLSTRPGGGVGSSNQSLSELDEDGATYERYHGFASLDLLRAGYDGRSPQTFPLSPEGPAERGLGTFGRALFCGGGGGGGDASTGGAVRLGDNDIDSADGDGVARPRVVKRRGATKRSTRRRGFFRKLFACCCRPGTPLLSDGESDLPSEGTGYSSAEDEDEGWTDPDRDSMRTPLSPHRSRSRIGG